MLEFGGGLWMRSIFEMGGDLTWTGGLLFCTGGDLIFGFGLPTTDFLAAVRIGDRART